MAVKKRKIIFGGTTVNKQVGEAVKRFKKEVRVHNKETFLDKSKKIKISEQKVLQERYNEVLPKDLFQITVHTDGACKAKGAGVGGYAGIVSVKNEDFVVKGGYEFTTNNRMEIIGVIESMKLIVEKYQTIINKVRVTVYSDSTYVTDSINRSWLKSWKKRNYKDVKNSDLWKEFDRLYLILKPKMVWVRGHNGNKYNEMCDEIATEVCYSEDLLVDQGYLDSL